MENEVIGAARVVQNELLVTMPSALDRAIQDVSHSLVDRVMCELEKGESICSLETVEQNQFSDLNSVEIRRAVKITRLVRCGECTHRKDSIQCPLYSEGIKTADDWFCADGEREVQE